MIYFIRQGDYGPIKIGHTSGNDAGSRLDSLQTASPYPLQLLHTIPGDQLAEFIWHGRLVKYRMRGEWFGVTWEKIKSLLDSARLPRADDDLFLRPRDVAVMLGVSLAIVNRAVRLGRLRVFNASNGVVPNNIIHIYQVDDFVASCGIGSGATELAIPTLTHQLRSKRYV